MIKVSISKQSNYPVSSPWLKKHLRAFLKEKGIVSDAEVSVALVGNEKMLDIAKEYMKDDKVHNVLSFPAKESKRKFIYPPNGKIKLGEIIVCYPEAVQEAKKEGKLIDNKVLELIKHAATHLMGIHHG